jgi:hypothetical protein
MKKILRKFGAKAKSITITTCNPALRVSYFSGDNPSFSPTLRADRRVLL